MNYLEIRNIKNNNKIFDIISKFVKYSIYKQNYELKYDFSIINKMIILNNIYNDSEISIRDESYIKNTL